jgi:hypothetical protein
MIEKFTFQRRIPLGFCLVLLILISGNNQAQSTKRQCISSYGASVTSGSATFMQTVGQPYSTLSFYETKESVLPGFQQPASFKVETLNSGLTKSLNLAIYPNPAAYSITIKSSEIIDRPLVSVLDVNGKSIFTEELFELSSHTINCAAWRNGVYLITVSDKNHNKSILKLMINK